MHWETQALKTVKVLQANMNGLLLRQWLRKAAYGKTHQPGPSSCEVKLIFDLKTSMEKLLQMKEDIKSETKDDPTKIKSELNSQVSDVEKRSRFISGTYDKVNNTANLALDKSEKLQQENLKLQTDIEELTLVTDKAKQYSKRTCLMLTGVPGLATSGTYLRRLRSDLLNPKFGSQKSDLL